MKIIYEPLSKTVCLRKGESGRFRHFSRIEAIKDYFQKLLNKKREFCAGDTARFNENTYFAVLFSFSVLKL